MSEWNVPTGVLSAAHRFCSSQGEGTLLLWEETNPWLFLTKKRIGAIVVDRIYCPGLASYSIAHAGGWKIELYLRSELNYMVLKVSFAKSEQCLLCHSCLPLEKKDSCFTLILCTGSQSQGHFICISGVMIPCNSSLWRDWHVLLGFLELTALALMILRGALMCQEKATVVFKCLGIRFNSTEAVGIIHTGLR